MESLSQHFSSGFSGGDPIDLGKFSTPDLSRDAFLQAIVDKANDKNNSTLTSAPRSKRERANALFRDNKLNLKVEDVDVGRSIAGIRVGNKNDSVLVVSFDETNIGYFSNDQEGQKKMTAFLLSLYEFVSDQNRANVIYLVENELESFDAHIQAGVLEETLRSYSFGAQSAKTTQQETRDIQDSTRDAKKQNKAQYRNNDAMKDFVKERSNSAGLALKEAALQGVQSLLNDYIMELQNLQNAYARKSLTLDTLQNKMDKAQKDFLALLGYHLITTQYNNKDIKILYSALQDAGISVPQINAAKRDARAAMTAASQSNSAQ